MASPKMSSCYFTVISILICVLLVQPTLEAEFGDPCTSHSDCGREFMCGSKGTCDCFQVKEAAHVKMFYDPELKVCFSYIGKYCTSSKSDDGLPPLRCVGNAYCSVDNHHKFHHARCGCNRGYHAVDNGRRCDPNVEPGSNKIQSMDQVRPEGWNSRSSSCRQVGGWSVVYLSLILVLFSMYPIR